MVFPTLDLLQLNGDRKAFLKGLEMACSDAGFFYLTNHGIPFDQTQTVLSAAKDFFDLDISEKNRIHIRHSSNFRGYSQMKNERDWREQIHFGQELSFVESEYDPPEYYRLIGENLWPESLGAPFRNNMLAYLKAVDTIGCQLLSAIAEILGLPEDYFQRLSYEPTYLLMKLICYYAQPNNIVDRPGVAAHCDWSWFTILLQDDTRGLEVLSKEGAWQAIVPAPGILSVNLGELLEILTKGRFVATAHRVINPSENKHRVSIPVFINPALNAQITPLNGNNHQARNTPKEHIHRVVQEGSAIASFAFGDSEWKRKSLGKWCYNTGCLQQ